MAYSTINKSTDHFNTKLYTGTGSSNAQTGVGFQPDWLWIKNRNGTQRHNILDAVRGVTKRISSNTTDAEATNSYMLSSFDSDGFTLGTDSDGYGTNTNGSTYVAWNWKANGSGSTNYDGSITSTVSANTTAGFSIIKYTGTGSNGTIGHGLGAVPKVYIVKNLDSVGKFWFFPTFFNNANEYLDGFTSTAGLQTDGNGLTNSTLPTNSVISLGTSSTINTSGNDIICYAFCERQGFSKFGNYTGNGNADGTFIYTGFKPAFVMIKRTDTTNNWLMYDNKRNTFNSVNNYFRANLNDAEGSGTVGSEYIDFLSNGFKNITSLAGLNASGGGYIYMAFAEAPLVGSNNVPCTAR